MYASEITRKAVWDGLIELDVSVRYCQNMHNRHQIWHIVLSCILATSGAGGIVSLLAHAPIWVQITLNAIIPFIAIWSIVANEGKKAHIFYTLTGECTRLRNEYKELWMSVENYQLSNDDVLSKLKNLNNQYEDIKSRNGSDLRLSNRINNRATTDSHKYFTHSVEGAVGAVGAVGVGPEPG